jgi:hypothetical protein
MMLSMLHAAGNSSQGVYLDNLQYEVISAAPVPEPAFLAIWGGLGIAGLVAARRRKKVDA